MLSGKLFNKKITPDCCYCLYGSIIGDDEVACVKKGISRSGSSCSKFSYDPLKREPEWQQAVAPAEYDQDDFKL
jgi:hypothetical protein